MKISFQIRVQGRIRGYCCLENARKGCQEYLAILIASIFIVCSKPETYYSASFQGGLDNFINFEIVKDIILIFQQKLRFSNREKSNKKKTFVGVWNGYIFQQRLSYPHALRILSQLTLDTKVFAKFFQKKLSFRYFIFFREYTKYLINGETAAMLDWD